MFIKGEKIYLREVKLSDVNEEYYKWMNDPEVTKYTEIRFKPQSMEEIRNYVEMRAGNQDEPFFAIVMMDGSDRHIGNIKLGKINWIHRSADISLFIGYSEYRGLGCGKEAIQLISGYAFKNLNLCKLKAGVYADNIGSYMAFRKAGFCIEGRLKDQVFYDGKRMDLIVLGKVNG